MTTEYIYAEPETESRIVFLDQDGKPHFSRDDAITENIKKDTERFICGQLARVWPNNREERRFAAETLVGQIASRHGTELRRMLVDLLDATS